MNRITRLCFTCLKFSVEAAFVFTLVMSIAYAATRLAEHCATRPLMPGTDSIVTLPAAKADRSLADQPLLFPTEIERQTDNYGNEYGRKLAEERENRSLGPWTDLQANVSWRFAINTPGMYEVELTLASDESEAGSLYEVKVCEETFSATVPSTGKAIWQKSSKVPSVSWKTVSVGRVEIPAGVHTLTIIPRTIEKRSLMNLSSVVLRPCSSDQ